MDSLKLSTSQGLYRVRMRYLAAIIAALTISFAGISVHAKTFASSTFNTDADGWIVVNSDFLIRTAF